MTQVRKRRPLLLALVAFLAVSLLGVMPAHGAAPSAISVLEGQFLNQINAERAERGLSPVRHDDGLANASTSWSSTMSSTQSLEHSTDGRAEIIARGYWTGQVTDAWMHSASHRNLIVDPNLDRAGVGVTCDANGQMWATVQFERRDTSIGTLRSSAQEPIVTRSDSGSGCNDSKYLGGVQRLYAAFFRRESDASGLAYWVEGRSDGITLDQIADVFSASPEFQMTYGSLNDRQFVDLIYRNVLLRSPDGGGYNYWVDMIVNGHVSRGQLMVQFSESAEFQSLTGIFN